MKKLSDGTEVNDYVYYYLLAFLDKVGKNEFLFEYFEKTLLHQLNIDEFRRCFSLVTEHEKHELLKISYNKTVLK